MKERLSNERVSCMVFCYQQQGMHFDAFIRGTSSGLSPLELSRVGAMYDSGRLPKLRPRLLKRMSRRAATLLVVEVQKQTVDLPSGAKDPRNWVRELNKIYPDNELTTKIVEKNRL